MTITEESRTTDTKNWPPRISLPDPKSDLEVRAFFIEGDSTTTPCIDYESTGEGIIVQGGDGGDWYDETKREEQGSPVFVEVSDQPDGFATKVLVDDTTCSDWVLGEAIRALTEVKCRRAAMRASGSAC